MRTATHPVAESIIAARKPMAVARRIRRYRLQLLLGSALLTRFSLLALIAWVIGSICSQLLFQQSAVTAAPWQAELFGWLELAQITDGWVLAWCYAGMIALYSAWIFWRIPRTQEVSEQALCFGGGARIFNAGQIRKLRPLTPALAWIKLAMPHIRPRLLSTPNAIENWFELRTENGTWLFACDDTTAIGKLIALIDSRENSDAQQTCDHGVPIWRILKTLALIALLATLPELTITLAIFYGAWRLIIAFNRKRKRAAWERATQRVNQSISATARPTRGKNFVRLLEQSFASLLILPLRAAIFLLRTAGALLGLIPWRGLRIIAGDASVFALLWLAAIVPAGLIGFALATSESYSQTSPSLARILLARAAHDNFPAIATKALERAIQTGNPDAIHAVLEAGTQGGVFHLRSYQADKRRTQSCRDALPIDRAKIKFVLDETPNAANLIFSARCALDSSHLQLALSTAAFQRQAGASIDLHQALTSGNPDLLKFALDNGANLEQTDWRGRTPLLAALDILANSQPQERESALRMVNTLIERGARLTATDAAQRSAAFIASTTELPAPLFDRLLKETPPQARSALGANMLHAVAASGDVARAQQIIARGTPVNALTADGRSALHFAKGGAMVWYLIDLGLDAELPDARGQTPFHHAVIRRDMEAARILGSLAGNKDATDIFGRSALDYAPSRPKTSVGEQENKTEKSAAPRKKNQPKPEWVQWRELADILHGYQL